MLAQSIDGPSIGGTRRVYECLGVYRPWCGFLIGSLGIDSGQAEMVCERLYDRHRFVGEIAWAIVVDVEGEPRVECPRRHALVFWIVARRHVKTEVNACIFVLVPELVRTATDVAYRLRPSDDGLRINFLRFLPAKEKVEA